MLSNSQFDGASVLRTTVIDQNKFTYSRIFKMVILILLIQLINSIHTNVKILTDESGTKRNQCKLF